MSVANRSNARDKKSALFTLFVLCLLLTACRSKTPKEEIGKAEKIGVLMNTLHKKGKFNGTVLVSEGGKIIYEHAFGLADQETKELLKPGSSFYLASVAKQFTAMAIMMLQEKNELSYGDKLIKYFPEFPSYAKDISIKHLMTHTSGLPDHYRLGSYKVGLKNADVLEILLKQDTLDFAPGDKFSYSNSGYVLLAMIAEKVTGAPFPAFLKASILEPLGMHHTLIVEGPVATLNNRAIGYNKVGEADDYELLTTGAGGMYGTVEDLFLWDQALNTEKLVSRQTLEEAYEPTVLNDGSISYYGFGWFLDVDNHTVAHSGGLSGFRTFIKRDLKNGNSYMFLTNFGDAASLPAIETEIDGILAGSADTEPTPHP